MEALMSTFTELKPAFLTGSRAYGVPREDSDIDLVVYIDPSELTKLAEALGTDVNDDNSYAPSMSVVEGRLNLVIVSEPEEYDTWLAVTDSLKKQAPVSKEQAVEAFQKALKAH
jgi:predicted nucleotidyltransferase